MLVLFQVLNSNISVFMRQVKECLRPDEGTSLQLLIAKLRNTNRNSYWNKETDKTRYHVSNHRMDPNETTFGKPYQDGEK